MEDQTIKTAAFWFMSFLVGSSMGGIQALSRSYFGKLIPPSASAEFFGFYNVFGKFAAITGPSNTTVGCDRKQGYLEALNSRGGTIDANLIRGNLAGALTQLQSALRQRPEMLPAAVYAAMMANVGVELKGTIDVCGLNHTSSMPTGAEDDPMYHTGSGDLPGTWSSGEVDIKSGAAYSDGSPTGIVENQVGPYTGPNGFYAGPWDVFGTSQAQFSQWLGPPVPRPDPPVGLVHIDGDAAYHDGDGTGLLYVTGDLVLNGHFTYRGLVYVEGDLQINGQAWVLGGVIVKGTTTMRLATGTAEVYYSSGAISEAISQASGRFTRLSWREVF